MTLTAKTVVDHLMAGIERVHREGGVLDTSKVTPLFAEHVLTDRCHSGQPDKKHTMTREIKGQTRWTPEQFGAFAAGTAESPDPKTIACPVCKGTGVDFSNRWEEGWAAHCEACGGYGEVEA